MKKLTKFLFYAFILLVILSIVFFIINTIVKNNFLKKYPIQSERQNAEVNKK